MARKVMITCAVTGGADSVGVNPAVPYKPADIARECLEAAAAGAAITHIHVRNPETGKPSMAFEHYEEVVKRIREKNDNLIINLTTGPGARLAIGKDDPFKFGEATTLTTSENRVVHIEKLNPEVCSLDIGSFNFGPNVFLNTPDSVTRMADLIKAAGAKPELEVFDLGGLRLAKALVEGGHVEAPPLFQICLGIAWAAEATPEAMLAMRNHLPDGAIWAAFGISRQQFPMAALAVILGGHVRVGLEDNLYLSHGVLAPGNAALVERAVNIVENLGEEVATSDDAREILGIGRVEPRS